MEITVERLSAGNYWVQGDNGEYFVLPLWPCPETLIRGCAMPDTSETFLDSVLKRAAEDRQCQAEEARLAAKLAEVEKERDALKAKLEHADTRIRRLEACIEEFLDHTEVPDANCSCHLAPPCGDCVEYGRIREVRGLANALLKERGV